MCSWAGIHVWSCLFRGVRLCCHVALKWLVRIEAAQRESKIRKGWRRWLQQRPLIAQAQLGGRLPAPQETV